MRQDGRREGLVGVGHFGGAMATQTRGAEWEVAGRGSRRTKQEQEQEQEQREQREQREREQEQEQEQRQERREREQEQVQQAMRQSGRADTEQTVQRTGLTLFEEMWTCVRGMRQRAAARRVR